MGDRENRIEITKKHIQKARETLNSAQILFDAESYSDSISRSYYAVFHSEKGLLHYIGESAKSHQGVYNLIYLHFVEKNIIDRELNRKINQLQSFRSTADYGFISILTREDAEEGLKVANLFIKTAENWINSN